MGKKIIVHVGTHKTGTTSIQKILKDNKNYLKEKGWILFHEHEDGGESPGGSVNSWFEKEGQLSNFNLLIKDSLAEKLTEQNSNVIVSSEHFSWVFNDENYKKFIDSLRQGFSEIVIVLFLRRQDRQLLSNYQQAFKYKDSTSADFFKLSLDPIPSYQNYFDKYLNYLERYHFYLAPSEKVNLKVVGYCDVNRTDSCREFIENILHEDISHFDKSNSNSLNRTLNKKEIIASYIWLHKLGIRGYQRFLANSNLTSDKYVCSREQAKSIMSNYNEVNEKLAKEMGLSNATDLFNINDFSMYPKTKTVIYPKDIIDANARFIFGLTKTLVKLIHNKICNSDEKK